MRSRPMRQNAVEVEHARAFVAAMEAITGFRNLPRDWAGPGTRAPTARAIEMAKRLMRDRQAMAERLTVTPAGDGGVEVGFVCGAAGDGEPGRIIIDRDGGAAIQIVHGGEAPGEVHAGVSGKAFRRALDDLISPRQSRYGVKRIEIEGVVFDSADEGRRYQMLLQEERLGRIRDIRRQVPYRFEEKGRLCFTYRSDFNYIVVETGEEIVEDVKGVRTEIYKLKKKLIEARFGIVISEWPITKKEAAKRQAAAQREAEKARKAEARRIREEKAAANRAEREAKAARRATKKEKGNPTDAA